MSGARPERAETEPAAAELATGYAMLARCWRQPTADVVDAVTTELLEEVDSSTATTDVTGLRTEHARLFVGPGDPPCPPYESVYRDDGDVLGPTTRAAVEWYRAYDLGLEPDWPDLPDHIATELEFVAHLLERGEVDACEQFLDEHLRQWTGEFCERVRAETREPYYEALATATEAAISAEQR
ncbi:chaperone TorD involved in molybdoenzyme TorA maturation [Halobiforma haloterrestris]|uniref:Chaperone TorD involved in molybdoenzyme TorA maturation n=1 Tax=Natronobacterium haloterrestre TaxID=148448 RepID=A0A1I1DFV3_NATHA|nr:molecular chaperone TorD family protein [Halobiforma haloterrestris]SFB73266.1 chaperone TorD involved in molybdoenzyme TorA maturation [Halobiforma haloterrestris]